MQETCKNHEVFDDEADDEDARHGEDWCFPDPTLVGGATVQTPLAHTCSQQLCLNAEAPTAARLTASLTAATPRLQDCLGESLMDRSLHLRLLGQP